MPDLTLHFTIEGGNGAGVNGTQKTGNKMLGSLAEDNAKTAFTVNRGMKVMENLATQVVDGHIASIGSRTGNITQQRIIQDQLSTAGKVIGIGLAFVANPIIGMGAVAGEMVSEIIATSEQNRQIMWQNRAAEQQRRRAGYNANYNR